MAARYRRRRITVAVSLLAAVGLAAGLGLGLGSGTPPARPAAAASTPGPRPGAAVPAPGAAATRSSTEKHPRRRSSPIAAVTTFLGPDGIESSAIVAENRRPGTTSWKIGAPTWSGDIEGFADTTDATLGQEVGLYVSTTASSFHVVAYRMGWYGGDGARQVWRSTAVRGRAQPSCPVSPQVNMVSCDNWSRSLTVRITSSFVPGDYLLKLIGSGGQQSYVLLTVWQPSSHAAYLLIGRSLTEEGWNTFGGYDFYQGEGPCTFDAGSYPPCNRARIVSFDRPYATGDGAADFLGSELPLVEFMEENGLDVSYVTDVTASEDPATLLNHKAILSLGHDETWTYHELAGVQRALAKGVNVAFLSASAIVRHARLQPSLLGPDREVVDYRDPAEDPLDATGNPMEVTGNTWASPPTDYSVTAVVGQLYSGFLEPDDAASFVVYDAGSFVFKGTGLHDGSQIPQVIASDIDHLATSYPTPADIQVLGHSPVPLSQAYTNQGQWGADTYSDMTYYTVPASKAGVFDSGTVNWITTLSECPLSQATCPTRLTRAITANLLRVFGQGPAGRTEPSVPNWKTLSPSGS
jgi:hypothetical protein